MTPEQHELELHEHLSCSDSGCFAVTLVGARRSQAMITDVYQVARAEALAHAANFPSRRPHAEMPWSYHDLRREEQMTWVHPERQRGRLTLGRVVNHQAVCPGQEDLGLVAVLGDCGHPVLFIATGVGARGAHHLQLLRSSAPNLRFGSYPLRDFRGAFPATNGLAQIGDRDRHPLLLPLESLPDSISQAA